MEEAKNAQIFLLSVRTVLVFAKEKKAGIEANIFNTGGKAEEVLWSETYLRKHHILMLNYRDS